MFSATLTHGISRQRAAHSLRMSVPIGCRSIFHPSGPKPSWSETHRRDFQPSSYPALSPQQFADARNSRVHTQPSMLAESSQNGFHNLIVKKDVSLQPHGTPAELWLRMFHRVTDTPPGPYDGRTVDVNSGDSIVGAWAKLNTILRANNVRQELRQTARHEQKGVKRRRLHSQRWRRRFADEVRKKVKLVIEMRNRDRMWGAKH